MAGYILNASTKSPFNKKAIDRCMPQPGHSIPNIFLLRQGIINFSDTANKANNCNFTTLVFLDRKIPLFLWV